MACALHCAQETANPVGSFECEAPAQQLEHDAEMPRGLPVEKTAARRVAAKNRAEEYSRVKEALANLRLTKLLEACPERSVISAYLPIGTELSPVYSMCAAHQMEHTICVPVVAEDNKPLRFRTWTPESKLNKGTFGVETPVDGDWVEPEYLIVPLLAFDENACRLGYGGGFYDRTLAAFRTDRPSRGTTAIGIAFAAQQFRSVPVQPFDQRLNLIITETRTIRWT